MWLELLDKGDPSDEEIRALVEFATPHRHHSGSAWTLFCLMLAHWVEDTGFNVDVRGLQEPLRRRGVL